MKKTMEEACAVFQQDLNAEQLLKGTVSAKAKAQLEDLNSRSRELREEMNRSRAVALLITGMLLQIDDVGLVPSMRAMFLYGMLVGIEMERSDSPGVKL